MRKIKGLLLDLGGVLYQGGKPIPGAAEALEALAGSGTPVRFLTNSSRNSRTQVQRRLKQMGLGIPREQIFTAPLAIRDHLERHGLRPLLLVHPELECEFEGLDRENPDAVVLGDAGAAFTYARLNRAFRLLREGAVLLAVGQNRYFREQDGLSLDAGPFVKALEYASGTQALILGKPSRDFFLKAVEALGCEPAEVLMVGDDVESDVNGALAAGLQAALVRTGKYQEGDEEKMAQGSRGCFADLGELIRELFG